jgi:hypothetical protein
MIKHHLYFFVFCRTELAFVFTAKGQFNRNTVASYVVSTRVYPRLLSWKTQYIKYVNIKLLPKRERSPSSIAQTKGLWLYKQIIAVHCKNRMK